MNAHTERLIPLGDPRNAMSDTANPTANLSPGDELANGKYVVTGHIGAGAMGTVYLGEHRALKRRVAIKVMKPEVFEQKPKAARRFEREARAAASTAPAKAGR